MQPGGLLRESSARSGGPAARLGRTIRRRDEAEAIAEPLATAFVRIRPSISPEDAQALEDQAAKFRRWADELDAFRRQFVVAPRDPVVDEIDPPRLLAVNLHRIRSLPERTT